jgi:hypothetical protein
VQENGGNEENGRLVQVCFKEHDFGYRCTDISYRPLKTSKSSCAQVVKPISVQQLRGHMANLRRKGIVLQNLEGRIPRTQPQEVEQSFRRALRTVLAESALPSLFYGPIKTCCFKIVRVMHHAQRHSIPKTEQRCHTTSSIACRSFTNHLLLRSGTIGVLSSTNKM